MIVFIRQSLSWLSMAIFALFIVLALAANWAQFLAFAGGIAARVIFHNALALAGGYATATLFRLSPYDRRAVTIETGIQNSGLGLVLIFGFFGGLGGMAVIASHIDMGLQVRVVDLTPYRARASVARNFDEAFL